MVAISRRTAGQKPRRHRLRIGRSSAGMYLIRLAFAATVVGLKQERTRENGRSAERLLSGVREPLFPPEMRPSRASAPTTYSLPINLSSSLSFSLSFSLTLPSYSPCPYRPSFRVVENENRIYIPSLALPGKYYRRVYAPAATSCDKQNPRRRKIDGLAVALLLTCSNCA